MKRSTPLRRKTRLTSRSGSAPRRRSTYKQRERDFPYMGWIKQQVCSASMYGGCSGPIEADHAGRRGVARKADDRTCIPLCRTHHRQRHDFAGPFKAWDRMRMRLWLLGLVDYWRQRWEGEGKEP